MAQLLLQSLQHGVHTLSLFSPQARLLLSWDCPARPPPEAAPLPSLHHQHGHHVAISTRSWGHGCCEEAFTTTPPTSLPFTEPGGGTPPAEVSLCEPAATPPICARLELAIQPSWFAVGVSWFLFCFVLLTKSNCDEKVDSGKNGNCRSLELKECVAKADVSLGGSQET